MHNDKICPKYNEPVLPNEKGNCSLCGEEIVEVISTYSLQQAIADGVLVKAFDEHLEKFMKRYVDDKPIVATAHLFNEVKHTELLDIWNKFMIWRQEVMPTLPEEDRMFSTTLNNKKVWVDETDEVITMVYSEDY